MTEVEEQKPASGTSSTQVGRRRPLLIMIIILLLLGAAFLLWWLWSPTAPEFMLEEDVVMQINGELLTAEEVRDRYAGRKPQLPELEQEAATVPDTPVRPAIPEAPKSARQGFDLLRDAIRNRHRPTMERVMTADSRKLFAEDYAFGRDIKDIEWRSEVDRGDSRYVNLLEYTHDGRRSSTTYAFTEELGEWKLDLATTRALQKKLAKEKAEQEDAAR